MLCNLHGILCDDIKDDDTGTWKGREIHKKVIKEPG
jgi:hypothetical protein